MDEAQECDFRLGEMGFCAELQCEAFFVEKRRVEDNNVVIHSVSRTFYMKFREVGLTTTLSRHWGLFMLCHDERSVSCVFVGRLINADPKEIIFTSGATESNNIAVKGIARYSKKNKQKNHVITVQTVS